MKKWIALAFTLCLLLTAMTAIAEETVYKMGDTVKWYHVINGVKWWHEVPITEKTLVGDSNDNQYVRLKTATCTQPGTAMVWSRENEYRGGMSSVWCIEQIDIQLEAVGHYAKAYPTQNPATCMTNASKSGPCVRCEETVMVEIPNTKLDHAFTKYITQTHASCKEPAQLIAYCDYNCGTPDVKADPAGTLDPDNHLNVVTLPAVPPTTTSTGLTEGKQCLDCQAIIVPQQVVDMLPMPTPPASTPPAPTHPSPTPSATIPPATGDNANVGLWLLLALVSLGGLHRIKKTA